MKIGDATILIVDDEPELLEIFSLWLGRSAGTVLKAPNGAEALKVLTGEKVHALISDIRMPVMDGITLVRRLFELNLLVPSIIFVSGFGEVDVREAYALGVEAMLPKPLSRHQLMHALESSLKRREELWMDPPTEPIQDTVEGELDTVEGAIEAGTLSLGRGGCCFVSPKPLQEGTVDFRMGFAKDGCELKGVGCVRWYEPKEMRAGIEFLYLEPACRDWVISQMEGGAGQSYIPRR